MTGQKPHSLEHTALIASKGVVWHYTCNAPSQEVLDDNGIEAIGASYGADPREVLLILVNVYEQHGYAVRKSDLTITSEQLLRRLR